MFDLPAMGQITLQRPARDAVGLEALGVQARLRVPLGFGGLV